MNIIIKVFFPLLLIFLNLNLFSADLVIKIPQKFHNDYLPLPPFPSESVNKLKTVNIYKELNDYSVRTLKQTEINYKYYFGVLNFDLSKEYLLDGLFGFGSDETNSLYTYINSVFTNNRFRLDAYADYNLDNSNTHLGYTEYRLPVDIGLNLYPAILAFETSGEYRDYYNLYNVLLGYDESIYFDLNLKIDTYFKPSLKAKYKEYLFIDLFFNIYNIYLGGLYIDDSIFPQLKINYTRHKYKLQFDTLLDEEVISYSIIGGLNYRIKPGIGFGYNINNDYDILDPEVVFKLDYDHFSSDIRFWEKSLKTYFSFINDDITSIISLKLSSFNNYEIYYEQAYKSLSLNFSLDSVNDDFMYEFSVGYKVVF